MLIIAGKFLLGAIHARGTDDEADSIFLLDLFDNFLEPFPVRFILYFARYAAALFIGQQDKVTPGNGYIRGEQCPFLAADFTEDLYQPLLPYFQDVPSRPLAAVLAVLFRKVLMAYVPQGQKAVLFAAEAYKCRL